MYTTVQERSEFGKLCTNKNHSYKHNEQINKQIIDNSERCGAKYDHHFDCISSY
jgi:hypothetical protein